MTALLADMVGPQLIVLGVLAVAGVFGTIRIVWFGFWLLRPARRNVAPPSDQPR